ncbi:MAG: hypothetical protein AAGA36_00095 [Pseudomonadota bacterium]
MTDPYFWLGVDADEWVRLDHPWSTHKWALASELRGRDLPPQPVGWLDIEDAFWTARERRRLKGQGLLTRMKQHLSAPFRGRFGARFN